MLALSLRMPPLALAAALLATVASGTLQASLAQDEPSSLNVSVRAADTHRPLPGAQVIVQGVGIGGVTDQSGLARLTDLQVGARAVEVRFLGYAPAQAVVVLHPGKIAALSFELELQPIQLAEIKVRTRRSILHTNGFFDRKGGGFGTFVTRQDIEAMRPRFLSDVLRRMAGINLVSSAYGGSSRASMRGAKVLGSCPIQYYVDGTMTALFNVDEIRPEDVEGLEIYRGAATIPVSFNKGTAMCGVIVIWTRVQ